MAKYGKKAQQKVKETMDEMKEGKLKSGKSGKAVKNRKQAIAIGLSKARHEGARLPAPKPARQSPDDSSRMADGRSDGGQAKVPKKK